MQEEDTGGQDGGRPAASRAELAATIHAAAEPLRGLSQAMALALERLRPVAQAAATLRHQIDRAHRREPEPTDPRERALWLKRNRNTGPRAPARAPRKINPARR